MDITQKVKELIAKQLNKSVEEIKEDMEIVKDLGADSLDVVEMLMTCEDELSVSVPEEDAVALKTVADVIAVVEKNMK